MIKYSTRTLASINCDTIPRMDYSRITEDLFIGTTPSVKDYDQLRDQGVRLVINMRFTYGPRPDPHESPAPQPHDSGGDPFLPREKARGGGTQGRNHGEDQDSGGFEYARNHQSVSSRKL